MSEKKNNTKPNINFSQYNDYELIYKACDHDEEAWEILIWKYSFLIRARIKSLKIPNHLTDDFYQEGCYTLIKCIKSFDDTKKMSFTSFFDMVLSRRFISLMRKEYKNSLDLIPIEQLDALSDNDKSAENINSYVLSNCIDTNNNQNVFSGIESQVYEQIIINGKSAKELSKEINIDVKIIYNAKQRVLKKLRNKIMN